MPKDTEGKELLKEWSRLYWDKTGDKYLPTWGRDTRILTELSQAVGSAAVEKLVHQYFEREQRIYSLPFFKACINELRQEVKNREGPKRKQMKDRYE